ncbi:MAG: type II 3-dehydroquinate dehydratase [Gammaproteobacteria bacterium]|nr:MAG: type II 3-dehydroquinate dehydratase [Gammaproteobacteria bacterium]
MDTILLVNGPNLNLLGKREPEIYGNTTIDDVVSELQTIAETNHVNLKSFQSNAEHLIVEEIQKAVFDENIRFIIINPAAYTHTSVAIRDAILASGKPFIELHISNVFAREQFRHKSYFSDIAEGVICGLGIDGYKYALQAAISKIKEQ